MGPGKKEERVELVSISLATKQCIPGDSSALFCLKSIGTHESRFFNSTYSRGDNKNSRRKKEGNSLLIVVKRVSHIKMIQRTNATNKNQI